MADSKYPRNGELFHARHWDDAWTTLLRGCEIPPSFEVFKHGLDEAARAGRPISPSQYAEKLAREYRRIQ